jgi:hypothetical protein
MLLLAKLRQRKKSTSNMQAHTDPPQLSEDGVALQRLGKGHGSIVTDVVLTQAVRVAVSEMVGTNRTAHHNTVRVALPCSACARALAPSAPNLLPRKLGQLSATDSATDNCLITHSSFVRAVLPCSAWARATAPSSSMMASRKLWQCQRWSTPAVHPTHSSFVRVALPCSA